MERLSLKVSKPDLKWEKAIIMVENYQEREREYKEIRMNEVGGKK